MQLYPTPLPGLLRATGPRVQDERGAFSRLFCATSLQEALGSRQVVQINHSLTREMGALRGLHFQHPPHAEMKLIRCLRGKAWDVAVDLRANSPTFRHWHAEELTPENGVMVVIPEGFAHGFQCLAPDTELLYLHTASYAPAAEGGIRHDDPALSIRWPLPPRALSDRDLRHPPLPAAYRGIEL
jgi:dTDP-4-dehydrorhamnose 3,5-epimerase